MRSVHLECKADEALVKVLGVIRKRITHHNDKGRVCHHLTKINNEIALIDEDPGSNQPGSLERLTFQDGPHSTKTAKDPRNNIIIVLRPALETWILSLCRISNINPDNYSLPADGHALHKVINAKLPQFNELVAALKEKANPGILWLEKQLNS